MVFYYKENCKDICKFMLFGFVKEYLMNVYDGLIMYGLEVDDVLGIYIFKFFEEYVCWFLDKDFCSISGFYLIDGNIVEIIEE